MDKLELRANIKFCFKLGKTFSETLEMIQTVYGENVYGRTTIYEWYKRFKDGRTSIEDDDRCGRTNTSKFRMEISKFPDSKTIPVWAISRKRHVDFVLRLQRTCSCWIFTYWTNSKWRYETFERFNQKKKARDVDFRKLVSPAWKCFFPQMSSCDPIFGQTFSCDSSPPAYSPDLAPNDFSLYPTIMRSLKERRFADINKVKRPTSTSLNESEQLFFQSTFQSLPKRWERCIDVSGEYFE